MSLPNIRLNSTLAKAANKSPAKTAKKSIPAVPSIPSDFATQPRSLNKGVTKRNASTIENVVLSTNVPPPPPMINIEMGKGASTVGYNYPAVKGLDFKAPKGSMVTGQVSNSNIKSSESKTQVNTASSSEVAKGSNKIKDKGAGAIQKEATTLETEIESIKNSIKNSIKPKDKQKTSEEYKFKPEEKEIPKQEKSILWALFGAGAVWGIFGGKKR